MLNVTVLTGRLVADPKLTALPSEKRVCEFSVAVDRSYTPEGKEREVDFFDVKCWDTRADIVAKYFKKGSRIELAGELRNENYTTKDGNKKRKFYLLADRVGFVDKKNVE